MTPPPEEVIEVHRNTCLSLLFAGALLSGCASQTSVKSEWQGDAPHGQSFSRVLVVGVSPDIDQRCPFERFLVSRMRGPNVTPIASCDAIDNKKPLTREAVDEAIATTRADAVLATLLVAKQYGVQEGGTRDTQGTGYYKATDAGWATGYYGYGAYGVPVIYGEFQTAPTLFTMQGEASVMSRLYETRTATAVYSMETTISGFESRDSGLVEVTAAIADRLRRDGLIR